MQYTVQDQDTMPTPLSALGPATLSPVALTRVVRAALGRCAQIVNTAVTPMGYPSSAIATEAVLKIHGTARLEGDDPMADPLPWAVFVKVLRSPRHWPGITAVPPPLRQGFLDTFPWREEADVLASGLGDRLPPGVRTPRVYRIDELGNDRVALWLEYVVTAETPWTTDRYAAAARLLGRWTGRRLGDPATTSRSTADGLRGMVEGLLTHRVFPQLDDQQLWAHPLISTAADVALQQDLRALSNRVPALLDTLQTLPQSIGHGDACPQNLLVPVDAADTFVAVDISWQVPEALGFDLGQLLIGRAHTGELAVNELPILHDILLHAYLTGLADEGHHPDPDAVRFGFDASLVIRSGFTALPLDALGDTSGPADPDEVSRRVALTRYITDLGLALDA